MAEILDRVALTGVAPIVPVRKVARTVGFYTRVLGFRLVERNSAMTYALVSRDDVAIVLLDIGEPKAVQAMAQYQSAYVWVREVAALWEDLAPTLERLPEGRVRPLFVKPDGRREFHLRDPDGFLLFFGEPPQI